MISEDKHELLSVFVSSIAPFGFASQAQYGHFPPVKKKQIVSLVSDLFTWRSEFTFVYVPLYNFGIPPPVTLLFLLDIGS